MKNINETHPSLKLKEINVSFEIESFDNKWRTEEHVTRSLIRSEDVQKHTIDKAVLRDIIYSKKFYEDIVKEIEKLLGDEK